MIAWTTLLETEDQFVSRFIGGLRTQLQLPLHQFNPVSEAHQRALGMELQYKHSWTSSSRTRHQTLQPSESSFPQLPDTTTPHASASKLTAPLDSIAASRHP